MHANVQITWVGCLLPTLGSVWEPPSFPTASRSVTPRLNSRASFPGSGTSTASMSVSSAVAVEVLSAPVSWRPTGTTERVGREESHQEQHLPVQHFSFQSCHALGHHWLSNIFIYLFNSSLLNVLEKEMATHSRTLAWKLPWTEEPGRLQSMGSLSNFTFTHWRRKWQPIRLFLPGESQGRGSLGGCRLWGRTELDITEAT